MLILMFPPPGMENSIYFYFDAFPKKDHNGFIGIF